MYCKKCGNWLADTAAFCGKCGTAVLREQPWEPSLDPDPTVVLDDPTVVLTEQTEILAEPMTTSEEKPKKQKMGKKKKILLAALVGTLVLVIAAGVIFLSYYLSSEQKLLRALKQDDYDTALEIYHGEMEGEGSEALIAKLEELINTVREEYTDSLIGYDTAMEELSTLRGMQVSAVKDLLDETERYVIRLHNSREAFEEAETLLQQGEYAEAIEKYGEVLQLDGNYAAAQTGILNAINAYREEILSEAAIYAEAGRYAEAIAKLEKGLEVLPGENDLQEQLKNYKDTMKKREVEALLSRAAGYADQGDYPKAIEALQGKESNAELNAAYLKYCQDYETVVLTEAEKMMGEERYDETISYLKDALTTLPGNTAITEMIKEAEQKKPVSLLSAFVVDSYNYEPGDYVDCMGNHCYDAVAFDNEVSGFVIFNLNQEYRKLTFAYVAGTGFGSGWEKTLKFCLDGVTVLTVTISGVKPQEMVTIDVTDCRLLEISFKSNWSGDGCIIVSDALLYP